MFSGLNPPTDLIRDIGRNNIQFSRTVQPHLFISGDNGDPGAFYSPDHQDDEQDAPARTKAKPQPIPRPALDENEEYTYYNPVDNEEREAQRTAYARLQAYRQEKRDRRRQKRNQQKRRRVETRPIRDFTQTRNISDEEFDANSIADLFDSAVHTSPQYDNNGKGEADTYSYEPGSSWQMGSSTDHAAQAPPERTEDTSDTESSDESDDDLEHEDPEEFEKSLWRGTSHQTDRCPVCVQLMADPHCETMVGKIQHAAIGMIKSGNGFGSLKEIIDKIVEKNNEHVVRPLRNEQYSVPAITALDLYKHYAIGIFSKDRPCRLEDIIEIEESAMKNRIIENTIFEELLCVEHNRTKRRRFDIETMRIMSMATNNKIKLLREKRTLLKEEEKIRQSKQTQEAAVVGTSLTNTSHQLVGGMVCLGGMTMATIQSQETVTSKTVYNLSQG